MIITMFYGFLLHVSMNKQRLIYKLTSSGYGHDNNLGSQIKNSVLSNTTINGPRLNSTETS